MDRNGGLGPVARLVVGSTLLLAGATRWRGRGLGNAALVSGLALLASGDLPRVPVDATADAPTRREPSTFLSDLPA